MDSNIHNNEVKIYCPACGKDNEMDGGSFYISPSETYCKCPICKTGFRINTEFFETKNKGNKNERT